MLAIVNYGVGNLFSLKCSLSFLGIDCAVSSDSEVISGTSHIILPGVGAFGDAALKLRESGLDRVVLEQVAAGKHLLGICVGMQLLFERSHEFGIHNGLGLLTGDVVPLREAVNNDTLKIPHMGWNSLEFTKNVSTLTDGIRPGSHVYYVHSYFVPECTCTLAASQYGSARISGLVAKGNVYGVQFHPEKSGKTGLSILKSFCELNNTV